MPLPRASGASWFMLAVLLAGCSDGGKQAPEDPDPEVDPNALPEDPLYNGTFVSKTGGIIDGDAVSFYCDLAANTTVKINNTRQFDGSIHSHDMWQGEETKVIFDGEVTQFKSGGNWFDLPGAIVHPGAGRADFKLDWDPTVPGEGRQLGVDVPFYKIPTADVHVDYLLNFTQPGQTHTIEFNFSANDRPHAERTSWNFKMNPWNSQAPTTSLAQVGAAMGARGLLDTTITWTIHRVYDCLPLDPPHYDLWNGSSAVTVLEKALSHDYRNAGTITGRWYGFQNGGGGIPDNKTVPPGTATIVVEMSWVHQDGIGQPLGLEYVGADREAAATTTIWKRPPADRDDGNKRTYYLAVHPLEADSPYAERSAWDFRWFIDNPGEDLDKEQGYGRFNGTVTWKVTAYRTGFGPTP